ncbi:Histone acetyltransferase [Gurleya vavrai]
MNHSELEIGCKVSTTKRILDQINIQAEILDIKHQPLLFYVHYVNYNKRLDEWISPSEILLENVEFPKKKKKTEEKKVEKVEKEAENQDNALKMKNVSKIHIRNFLVDAWYFSPYPPEIANQPVIYLCSFCLFYFKDKEQLKRHNCGLQHPPGNEIFRQGNLSFFEVDGHIQKKYCRNLCLLSKLFLDHKTLYYDVDPFLFYILCEEKDDGFHLVGYFSKEKESLQGFNLACILTMPYCQRKGYGRILIEFSYLLSKKEGIIASPEKPLSDLGLLSYRKYWREKILAFLSKNKESEVSIQDISKETFITEEDIMAVLCEEGILKFYDGKSCFIMKEWFVEKEILDKNCLEWEPSSLKLHKEIK